LPDDVQALLDALADSDSPWRAACANEILELPGVGLCVPDLVFSHATSGRRVFLEVLGYWSREAVWRRVELAERGLPEPIVFAASSRLRVSEAVLDGVERAALYVYKGVISPRAVLERVAALGGG
jgi:predicted nuclease of restriction endonuclease-like RecB superfamily